MDQAGDVLSLGGARAIGHEDKGGWVRWALGWAQRRAQARAQAQSGTPPNLIRPLEPLGTAPCQMA